MGIKVFTTFTLEEALQSPIRAILQPVDGTLIVTPHFSVDQTVGSENTSAAKAEIERQRTAFVKEHLGDAAVAFTGGFTSDEFAVARTLKWLQVPYAGVNRLLENKALAESDVTVTNAAGMVAGPLSDQVLGYVISFSRALPQQWQAQQEKIWKRDLHLIELAGQTLGIVGYGSIGREVAKRAKAFGMRVVATKNNTQGDYPELDKLWPNTGLDNLLAESDYVVIAAPLTPETIGLIGRNELEKMKATAYLINIARGQLVKEQELIEILKEKRIAGAALDVFEREPLPSDSPLWELDNVILTPHSSGNFDNYMKRAVELFCQNLRRYVAGEPLFNVVDKKRGY